MRAVPGNTEKVPGVYQEIQAGENERAVDSADAVAGAVHSGDTGDGADIVDTGCSDKNRSCSGIRTGTGLTADGICDKDGNEIPPDQLRAFKEYRFGADSGAGACKRIYALQRM